MLVIQAGELFGGLQNGFRVLFPLFIGKAALLQELSVVLDDSQGRFISWDTLEKKSVFSVSMLPSSSTMC